MHPATEHSILTVFQNSLPIWTIGLWIGLCPIQGDENSSIERLNKAPASGWILKSKRRTQLKPNVTGKGQTRIIKILTWRAS